MKELGSPASQNSRAEMKELVQETSQQQSKEIKVWNTKNLGLRLASDIVSGGAAATMVAPLITIIDKFVVPMPSSPIPSLPQ